MPRTPSSLLSQLPHLRDYLLGGLASKAIGIVSLPVMTRLLAPQDYGLVHIAGGYVSLFAVFCTLGTTQSIARYYYEGAPDFSRFLGTSLLLILCLQTFFVAVVCVWPSWLAATLSLPIDALVWVVPMTTALALRTLFEAVGSARRESRVVVVLQVSFTYAGFLAAVGLVLAIPDRPYRAVLGAHALVGLAVGVFAIRRLRHTIEWHPRLSHLKYSLAYGVPLIPYLLSNVVLGHFDRIMIGTYCGHWQAGLYSVAYNLGSRLSIFSLSIREAWAPEYFAHSKLGRHGEVDREHARIMRFTVVAAVALIGGATYLGLALAHRDFYAGFHVIPPVVVGYVFYTLFHLCQYSISFSKRTYLSTAAVLAAAAANITLNAVFLPRYGYRAAAYTTLASYALMALCAWAAARYVLATHVTPLRILCRPLIGLAFFLVLFALAVSARLAPPMELGARLLLVITFAWLLLRSDVPELLLSLRR